MTSFSALAASVICAGASHSSEAKLIEALATIQNLDAKLPRIDANVTTKPIRTDAKLNASLVKLDVKLDVKLYANLDAKLDSRIDAKADTKVKANFDAKLDEK